MRRACAGCPRSSLFPADATSGHAGEQARVGKHGTSARILAERGPPARGRRPQGSAGEIVARPDLLAGRSAGAGGSPGSVRARAGGARRAATPRRRQGRRGRPARAWRQAPARLPASRGGPVASGSSHREAIARVRRGLGAVPASRGSFAPPEHPLRRALEPERVRQQLVGAPARLVRVGDAHRRSPPQRRSSRPPPRARARTFSGDRPRPDVRPRLPAGGRRARPRGTLSASSGGGTAISSPTAQQREGHPPARREPRGPPRRCRRRSPTPPPPCAVAPAVLACGEALAVERGDLGSLRVDEVRERVRQPEFGRPQGALLGGAEQPRLRALRPSGQRTRPGARRDGPSGSLSSR